MYTISLFQGITVKIDEHTELVVARILAGSMIEKQGMEYLLSNQMLISDKIL